MSRVVVVRYPSGDDGRKFNKENYKVMLQTGFRTLSEIPDTNGAVKKYIPGGTVGMKVNCLSRKFNSSPLPLAEALADLLVASGISPGNIVVWERTVRDLEWGGFPTNGEVSDIKCLAADSHGMGYSMEFYSSGPVNSLISKVLTDVITYNINLPILKEHSLAGMSGAMKNMYGSIHNPNKYHDNNCDPFVAHVSNLEPIKGKIAYVYWTQLGYSTTAVPDMTAAT